MSKVTKKLISMIMCLAMAVTSVGTVALAADETTTATADTATATASPEATAAPEATTAAAAATEAPTPEPTEEPSAYADDAYYDRALTLCTALGIVEGYEDGSVKPDSTITRAEMSALVLRMLNTEATADYTGVFNDVTSEHWAASTIQTAATMGIINGMGDGSFNPDGNVLYEQVEKMLVCALGYETDATYEGGYPTGYAKKATDLKLTDHAASSLGTAADRGLVIKMIYNALLTKYNKVVGTGVNGQPTYSATDTLAKTKFNLIDSEGVLSATATKSMDSSTSSLPTGQVVIDGITYQTELKDLDDYVGTEITFYYLESTNQDATIIAVTNTDSKSTTFDITDMSEIETVSGFESGTGRIELEKGSTKKCDDAVIIYNNERITSAEFAQALADDPNRFVNAEPVADSNGNYSPKLTNMTTINDLFTPDSGSIKLIDEDDDGNYDTVFITAYETMLVSSATDKKIVGTINGNSTTTTINTDTDTNTDLTVTVVKAGNEVKPKNLKKNDVASIARSLSGDNISVVVTGESIVGAIDDVEKNYDELYVTMNDTQYVVDANAYEDAKLSDSVTAYLDASGRIGYISGTTSSVLSSSEEYAWVMNAYTSADGEDYVLKLYRQDGTSGEYGLASTVKYWAYNASAPKECKTAEEKEEIVSIVGKIGTSYDSSGYTMENQYIEEPKFLTMADDDQYQIRLAKVKINSKNEVTQLYLAIASDQKIASGYSSTDALVFSTTNYNGTTATKGTMLGGKQFYSSTNVFQVPAVEVTENTTVGGTTYTSYDDSAMKAASNYTLASSASGYLDAENGVAKNFTIGAFDEGYATALVEFKGAAGKPVTDTSDYGTASDNSTMAVSGISVGIDDDDETVYTIKGYKDGSEMSVTTTETTSLFKMAASSTTIFTDKTKYGVDPEDPIWKADDDTSIASSLREGDIIGMGGSVLIKMVDVKELANYVVTGEGDQFVGSGSFSATRDGLHIGAASNVDAGDTVMLNIGSDSWYFDTSSSVTLVNVTTNDNGFVSADVDEEGIEASEIMDFDADEITGDYVFSRHFKNGAQREIVVYRFNMD